MNLPLVSVLMVSYNHVDYIDIALASALEQDYPNFEIIIADDGSTDGTVEIIREYAQRHPAKILSIVEEGHLGITGNYNRALKACRGKYIAFLDGDDIFLPGKLSKQVDWLEADDRRVLCGHETEVFDTNTGERMYLWSERAPLIKYGRGAGKFIDNPPYHGVSIMVRANSIPSYGFDKRIPISSDLLFFVDSLAGGGVFGAVDGIYLRHRRHENNITKIVRKTRENWEDHFVMLALIETRYPQLVGACRKRKSKLFAGLAKSNILEGNVSSARIYLRNALIQDPFGSWKVIVAYLSTYLPGRAMLFAVYQRTLREQENMFQKR